MKFPLPVLTVLAATLSLSSCAQFFVKEKTYLSQGGSELNGAAVRSAVKPMGGKAGVSLSAMVYSAGIGETDGPFLWRVEATGEEGVHESLIVHKVTVRTSATGRSEPYPAKWLGIVSPFEVMKGNKNVGKVFAKYQLPGKLEVFPEKDGEITLVADISVKSKTGTKRREITFRMEPSIARDTQTVFFPKEIVSSLGRKDPTEWDWSPVPGARYSDDFWGPDRSFHY